MKRLLMLLLSLLLCAACAQAETDGDFTYEVLSDGTAKITGYTLPEDPASVQIPAAVNGTVVTAVGSQAVSHKEVKTIIIPNSVRMVAGDAFLGCSGELRLVVQSSHPTLALIDGNLYEKSSRTLVMGLSGTLNIPEGIQAIGERACYGRGYETINLPSSLKTVGREAFSKANAKGWPLREGIEVIGEGAYEGFLNRETSDELVIPSTVREIGRRAFAKLSFTLGGTRESNAAHGSSCVSRNSAAEVRKIDLPEGLTLLEEEAFADMTITPRKAKGYFSCSCSRTEKLQAEARQDTNAILRGKSKGSYYTETTYSGEVHVTLPAGMTEIPAGLFRDAAGRVWVDVPATGALIVREGAFKGCYQVNLHTDTLLLAEADALKVEFLVWDGTLRFVEIANGGFAKRLRGEFVLDERITQWPFSNVSLSITEIPAHITVLGEKAVISQVQDFYLHSGLTDIHENAFHKDTTFLVEEGSYAEQWVMANNRLFSYVQAEETVDLSWLNPEAAAGYDAAQALADQGDYEAAAAAFEALGDFSDAPEKVPEMRYLWAGQKAENGDFAGAKELYDQLGDYKDAKARSAEMTSAAAYAQAEALEAEADYPAAREAFLALGDYKDSTRRAADLEGKAHFGSLLTLHGFNKSNNIFFKVKDTDYYGLMDYQGNVVVEPCWTVVQDWQYDEGSITVVENEQGKTIINADGKDISPEGWTRRTNMRDGLFLVEINRDTALIMDAEGNTVAELPKKKGRSYNYYAREGLVVFTEDGKQGCCDLKGKVVIKAKYKYMDDFVGGLAVPTTTKGKPVLINTKGKELVKAGKYDYMRVLNENLIVVGPALQTEKEDYGIINQKGKELIKVGSMDDPMLYGNLIVFKENGKYGALNLELEKAIPSQCASLAIGYNGQVAVVRRLKEGLDAKNPEHTFCLFDISDGNLSMPEIYQGSPLAEGYTRMIPSLYSPYIAAKDAKGYLCILDSQGNVVRQ